jgi:hypothetical protein
MKISRRELRTIILKEIRNISENTGGTEALNAGGGTTMIAPDIDMDRGLYSEIQRVGFKELERAGRVDKDFDTMEDVIIAEAPSGPIIVNMRSIQGVIPDSKTISVRVSGRQFVVGMFGDMVNQ